MLCVGLLDNTVKIFFEDSSNSFHHGHSLPILSMDVSDDAYISEWQCRQDYKNLGSDFGDCHRSLSGHSDSIHAFDSNHIHTFSLVLAKMSVSNIGMQTDSSKYYPAWASRPVGI